MRLWPRRVTAAPGSPFDVETGDVRIDDPDIVVPASLTLPQFAEWPHDVKVQFWPGPPVGNGVLVGGERFHATLTFDGDHLTRFGLVVSDPAVIGTGWDNYDMEGARRFHDEYLERWLGKGKPWQPGSWPYGGVEYRFWWGRIGSYVHPQDMNATINIGYR